MDAPSSSRYRRSRSDCSSSLLGLRPRAAPRPLMVTGFGGLVPGLANILTLHKCEAPYTKKRA